jgi:hypothetical protein
MWNLAGETVGWRPSLWRTHTWTGHPGADVRGGSNIEKVPPPRNPDPKIQATSFHQEESARKRQGVKGTEEGSSEEREIERGRERQEEAREGGRER